MYMYVQSNSNNATLQRLRTILNVYTYTHCLFMCGPQLMGSGSFIISTRTR